MKSIILIAIAMLTGISVSQAEGIVPLFDRPVLDMPSGYEVLDHSANNGQVLKLVNRPASLRVAGYVENGNRRYYLSEWSWDHLAKNGREPTWVLPLDEIWSSISPEMLVEGGENAVTVLDEPREIFFPSGYVCACIHDGKIDLSHRSERPTSIEIYGWVDVETDSRRGRVRVYQGDKTKTSWLMPRASGQPAREGIVMFPEVERREFPEGRLVLCGAGPNAVSIERVSDPTTLSIVGRVERDGRDFLISQDAYLSWEKNGCLETTIPFEGKFQEPCSGEKYLLDHAGEKRWMVSRLVSLRRKYPNSYSAFSHSLVHDISWGRIDFEKEMGTGSAQEVLRRLELLEAVAGRKPAEDTLHAAMKFLACPKEPWNLYRKSTEPEIRSTVMDELQSNVLTYTPLLQSIYQHAADGYGETFPRGTLDIDKVRWWQDWAAGTRVGISFRLTERLSELSSRDRDTFSKIVREATESCTDIEIATDGIFSPGINEEEIKEIRDITLTDQMRSVSQLVGSTLAAAEKGDADAYENGIEELAKQAEKEFEQALKADSKAAYELIFHEALLLCLSKGHGALQDSLTLPLHQAIAEVHSRIDARRSALKELRGLSSGSYRTKRVVQLTEAMKDGEIAISLKEGGSRSRKLKKSEAKVEVFRIAGVAEESSDTIDAQYGCLVYREGHPPVFHTLIATKDLDIYTEMMLGNFTKRGLGQVANLWRIRDDWFDETYRSVHRKLFAPLEKNLSGYSQVKIEAPKSLSPLPLNEIFQNYAKDESIGKIALAVH